MTTCLILFPSLTSAQVIPDETLGSESSEVNSIDELRDRIEGGATRGENLFHSFQEFNVESGRRVDFANSDGIANIFSRVTGENISEIFGSLGVEGNANLFFINPNGIVFGENSSVNVNGSFLATTAESIEFIDRTSFSTSDKNPGSTLTVSVPIGLGLGSNPGDIEIRGSGHTLSLSSSDSFVPEPIPSTASQQFSIKSQRNIALVGGNVLLNGAIVETDNGKIEVAGTKKGSVGVELSKWNFNYDGIEEFGDITLDSQSLVNASGNFGGSIGVTGNTVSLENGSLMIVQNRGSALSEGIEINSSSLKIIGGVVFNTLESGIIDYTPSAIISESIGKGAGNIVINTEKLLLNNGGQIASIAFGINSGGDILVEASDSVRVSSFFEPTNRFSTLGSTTLASGNGGKINLDSPKLLLDNGGAINSGTYNSGNAGNLNLNISQSTNLSGFLPNFFTPTSILSVSFNTGDTGNVSLNTTNLNISNGATLSSLSVASGNAGEVTVNASEMIQIENRIFEDPILASAIASSAEIVFANQISAFGLPPLPSGNAGDVTINTPHLSILDGGIVAVRNTGTGNGGELQINAERISLDNGGEISASTLSGDGGNITLNIENLELLNQSQITASAEGAGDGGNITIDSNAIVGLDNSNITANAVLGDGGNIQINATGVFFDPSSDITASSQLGIDGTVQINTPDINLQRELEQVAPEVVINDRPLVNRCLSRSDRSPRLILGGTGGLPQNPDSNYTSATFSLTGVNPLPVMSTVKPLPNTQGFTEEDNAIIAADTVVRTKDGSTLLVAKSQIASPTFCQARKFGSSTSSPNSLR